MTPRSLPRCQLAVDALHRRITSGRVRVLGTATVTGLSGRTNDLTPDELAIIEAAMCDRFGARMSDIWMRDALDAAGVSEDDWALASEFAYHAIRRGLTGEGLALTVERIMRAGPFRDKWDDPRGAVSWLTQTVANAVATVQKRLADQPVLRRVVDELEDDQAPAKETPRQTFARLQHELAQARVLLAVQQTVIRGERAEKEELKARLGEIMAVLRNERMSPTSRVVAIVLGETVEQLRAHGHTMGDVMRADLARKAGVSEATITRESERLCTNVDRPRANPDAPIVKVVTTIRREVDGVSRPTSTVSIAAKADVPSVLAAYASYRPAEPRKHGGVRTLGCPDHPDAALVVRSVARCAECHKPLGRPTESLRKQVDAVGTELPAPVIVVNSVKQVDAVGEDAQVAEDGDVVPIDLDAQRLRKQDAPVGPPRIRVGVQRPWRCHCGSYERFPKEPKLGEAWRCDGCGARSAQQQPKHLTS